MSLFNEICSYKNLMLAFDRVEDNAGAPGVDNVTIEEFSIGLDKRLMSLRNDLINGTYTPSPLLKVGIPKKSGKLRWLSIPAVRDRVIQTSACIVLAPLLDKEFEECSFAYRKDRSVQKAIQRIIELRDRGYLWVVDADITSFFDEIDHDILLKELSKYIYDERVLDLIKRWLDVEVVYKGKRERLTKGVPQGSPISPLLSNLYLDSFDEALQEARFRHVRFADDFVILCKDKPDAEDALELTGDVLRRLNLSLNRDKTRITDFNQGFRYLGVEFIRSMVFRPVYKDETEIEDTQRAEEYDRDRGKHLKRKFPDTTMGEAFEKAFKEKELDIPDSDEIFDERPDIEPSESGNPFLRTLYLLEQGTVLTKESERFRIIKDNRVIKEIPVIKVDQILVFGNIQISTQAMKFCIMKDIPVILLSSRGRYFGAIESFNGTKVALHKRQFELAEDRSLSLKIGKAIVCAKINNSKTLIQRYARKREFFSFESETQRLNVFMSRATNVRSHDELMGIEGAASAVYFGALRSLIGDEWGFNKRQKQPPPDPVNSMLSYGYTLLFYNIYSMIRMHGLNPYIGFLHGVRDGHPSLVSDILEEFRAPVVDAMVMNLIIRKILKKTDFIYPEEDGLPCLLKGDARRIFIRAFEGKMNSAITHPSTGYKVDYRRCIDLQVQTLKRLIEGKSTEYRPMYIR